MVLRMASVVVFHHVQGLTPGIREFAERLRAHNHQVTTPDLFEGRTFPDLDAGGAYRDGVGIQTLMARAAEAVESLPNELVYLGFSMGSAPAETLAVTRPGALAAVLCSGAIGLEYLDQPWPKGVLLQLHGGERDPWLAEDDLPAIAEAVPGAELYWYPVDGHLFADSSLPEYHASSTDLLVT